MRVFYCIVGGSGRWIAREMSETGTVMTDWIYAGHAPRVTDQYIIIARQLTRQVIGTDPMPDPHYLGGGSSVTFAWDGHHMRQIY